MPFERYRDIRDAYGEMVVKLARENPDLVVFDADLGKSLKTDAFAKEFPSRYFNPGVSEQAMVGMAVGLAYNGKKVFVGTFACFFGRAWEFTKLLVSGENVDVKLIGSHGGLITGKDGHSAQELFDIVQMRTLPNMAVVVPSDYGETARAVEAIAALEGPAYLRLVRTALPDIHNDDYEFVLGRGEVIRQNLHDKITIIACGPLVANSLEAAIELEKEDIHARVINMASVKPADEALIIQAARETGIILAAEDGHPDGLGGVVKSVVTEHCPVPVHSVGVKETFGESGEPKDLYRKYGLDTAAIFRKVKDIVSRRCPMYD